MCSCGFSGGELGRIVYVGATPLRVQSSLNTWIVKSVTCPASLFVTWASTSCEKKENYLISKVFCLFLRREQLLKTKLTNDIYVGNVRGWRYD